MWRSLVARVVRDDEVAGSNPVIPTKEKDPPPHGGSLLAAPRPSAERGFLHVGAAPRRNLPGTCRSCPSARRDLAHRTCWIGPVTSALFTWVGPVADVRPADHGSGRCSTAWGARMGSGQLPTAAMCETSVSEAVDSTAGAAAENASAPARTAPAAIFFNIEFLNKSRGCRSFNQVSTTLVDTHCKMVSTETVKHLVQRMSGIRRYPWGTDLGEKLRAERLERGLTQAELRPVLPQLHFCWKPDAASRLPMSSKSLPGGSNWRPRPSRPGASRCPSATPIRARRTLCPAGLGPSTTWSQPPTPPPPPRLPWRPKNTSAWWNMTYMQAECLIKQASGRNARTSCRISWSTRWPRSHRAWASGLNRCSRLPRRGRVS